MSLPEGVFSRFNSKWVRNEDTGCHEWKGAIRGSSNYGAIKIGGKPHYAHRVAWELEHGEIPKGMNVLHTCDNPNCVNPDHLELGNQSKNMRDMHKRFRAAFRVRHCPLECSKGHERNADTVGPAGRCLTCDEERYKKVRVATWQARAERRHTCRNGHRKTVANTRMSISPATGKPILHCKECARQAKLRYRIRKEERDGS
jgi:hypothetical protein